MASKTIGDLITTKSSLKHICSLKDQAYKAYQRKDYRVAKRVLIEAIESLENHEKQIDSLIYFNVGICYLNIGNLEKCEHFLIKAIQNDPYFAIGMYFLGYCKRLMNDYSADNSEFDHAIKMIQRTPEHDYFKNDNQKSQILKLNKTIKNLTEFHYTDHKVNLDFVDYSQLGLDLKLTVNDCEAARDREIYENIFDITDIEGSIGSGSEDENISNLDVSNANEESLPTNKIILVLPEKYRKIYDIKIFKLKEMFTMGLHHRQYVNEPNPPLLDRFLVGIFSVLKSFNNALLKYALLFANK